MVPDYDLLIRNGRVFDGLGSSKSADVAVKDGRIVAVASAIEGTPRQTLDATGLWVAPGFIDIHTHYDLEVEIAPSLSESVRHGVTTVVMGGCSLSTIFGDPEDLAHIFSRVETLPPELVAPWLNQASSWSSPDEYFSHLRSLPLGPNVACMLGHSALRVKVMGLKRSLSEKATPAELLEMKAYAEAALQAGCIGISIDMVHWHKVSGPFAGRALPSHHADFEEYAMLADVCRARDAVFQVTPNPENIWSFFNIVRLSPGLWRAPLRNTILSALDMADAPHLWRLFPALLFVCNRLLGCNIRFQTLSEPFTIYADGCLTPFFEEFTAGVELNNCRNRDERLALWLKPGFQESFLEGWNQTARRTFHRDLGRMTIVSAPDADLHGKTFVEAAKQAGADPADHFMTLLQLYDEDLRWMACSANIRDNVRQELIKHPHILPGFSDAGAHSRNLAFFDSALSVLRQAVSSGFMSAERAISRVTREPSNWFNLAVGSLKEGAKADIVILDPKKLPQPIPAAVTIPDPVLAGASRMVKRDSNPAVVHVFVNGTEVVRDGAPLPALSSPQTGVTLGQVLTQVRPAKSAKEALCRYRNRIGDLDNNDLSWPPTGGYWPIFLLKHQHPANVALHCAGFILMYAIPAIAWYHRQWWVLILMPLSQAIGLLGHWMFERSPIDPRDTIFSWRAFFSLHLMFVCVISGRYGAELVRAQRLLHTSVIDPLSNSILPAQPTS